MTGLELMLWRRERKLTQGALAKLLGKSRETVGNWEAGRNRLPMDIVPQLERLAYTLSPRVVDTLPDVLTHATAHLRPDLELYLPKHGKGWPMGADHPYSLGFKRTNPNAPFPFAILNSAEYAEAVARSRRQRELDKVAIARNIAIAEDKARRHRFEIGRETAEDIEWMERNGRD